MKSAINVLPKFNWNQLFAAYAASSVFLGVNLDVVWFNRPERYKNYSGISLIIEAMSIIAGGIIGAITSDTYGRRKAMLLSSIFVVPRLLIFFSISRFFESLQDFEQITWSFVSFGSGFLYVVVPLYISEISDSKNRGQLMVMQQPVFFFGQFATRIVIAVSSLFDAQFVDDFMNPALLVMSTLFQFIILFMYPDTPEYLTMKERYDEAIKSLAVFRGINASIRRRRDSKTIIAGRGWSWAGENVRSLVIIFMLIAIRRASGDDRNFQILSGFMSASNWSELNLVLHASLFAVLFIFSVFLTFSIRVLSKKLSLLVVIVASLIAAVISACDLTKWHSVLVATIHIQYLSQLTFLAVTFNYVGQFFLINFRSSAMVRVLCIEVMLRMTFSEIDLLLIGSSITEGKYTRIHSYFNCGSLFVAFVIVFSCFPKINNVPRSELGIEISKKGECLLVEKSVFCKQE